MSKETEENTQDQAALAAESESESVDPGFDVEFEGHTYRVLDGQPDAKALGHVADYLDDQNLLYAISAIKEMIGKQAWIAWCTRHDKSSIEDMLTAINLAFAGNS